MMSSNCLQCGNSNDADARFCPSCGAALHNVVQATGVIQLPTDPETGEFSKIDASTFDALPGGSAYLVVRRGAMEGARFALVAAPGDSLSIGRSPDSNIFLDDVTVSRKHAAVSYLNGQWTIDDAGSLNGTYVNKNRVSNANLVDGDEVQIGKYRFVFVLSVNAGQ
jgi:hypothetical protein